jgi:POT family proton-dependent oligopeptide transporter
VFGTRLNAAQIPSLNPVLVMLLIPLMNALVYPAFDRAGVRTTPLRRMTAGMLIASLSFVAVALVQREIDARGAGVVHVAWQLVPYVLITLAEVLVSVTGLEFAYSQAPARMKSTIMSFWNLMVAVGNVFASFMSGLERLPLQQFFWVFAGLMLLAAIIFGIRARYYVARDQVQV